MTIASEPRGQLRLFDLRRNWRSLTHRPPGDDPVVDGVRALAILWVIPYHLVLFHLGSFTAEAVAVATGTWTQWTSRGDMGVDLFFVISGYLIGGILFAEYRSTGTVLIRRFYVRRFLRLIPVYIVAMLVGLYFVHNIPREAILMAFPPFMNADMMWTNLLYVNNFLPINRQYMGWCWSLAIEEQFYLLFPAFLLLIMRVGRPLRTLGALLLLGHRPLGGDRPAWLRAAVPRPAEHAVLGRSLHDRVPESLHALRCAPGRSDRLVSDDVPSRARQPLLQSNGDGGWAWCAVDRADRARILRGAVVADLRRGARGRAEVVTTIATCSASR